MRDDRRKTRAFADRDRLADADARAEVRLGREPVVIGEVRARPARRLNHGDDFIDAREVPGLVVESRGHPPRALRHAGRDETTHSLNVVGGRTSIHVADHALPRAVEADVAADVNGQAGSAECGHLLRDIERRTAIRVDDLCRHALRKHVDRGRQRVGRGVAMYVDEARRHVEAARVDVRRGRCGTEVADGDDVPASNSDVGAESCAARSVEHSAVSNNDVERVDGARRLRLRRGNNQERDQDRTDHCGESTSDRGETSLTVMMVQSRVRNGSVAAAHVSAPAARPIRFAAGRARSLDRRRDDRALPSSVRSRRAHLGAHVHPDRPRERLRLELADCVADPR